MAEPLLFKLARNPKDRGLRCDGEGLFLAGKALLERDVDDRFQPRPSDEIRKILSGVYRADADWSSRIRSIGVVAKALNEGDLARATMAAVLMRLPEPGGAIRISDVDGALAKADFNPDEPRDDRGRWTNEGSDGGHLLPAQFLGQTMTEPLLEPLIGPLARPTIRPTIKPFPGTIDVPPIVAPNVDQFDRPTNPFPDRPECVEQWAAAKRFCDDLERRGKLGKRGYRGFGQAYNQCLMGQASEDCGGNPTSMIA